MSHSIKNNRNHFLENTNYTIWSFTWPELDNIYMGFSAEKLFGHSLEKLNSNSFMFHNITHNKDKPVLDEFFQELTSRGFASRGRRIIKNNGETAWVFDTAQLVQDQKSNSMRIEGATHDVVLHKEAEKKHILLSKVVSEISDSIMVTDTNFKIAYINKKCEEMFGYTLEELTTSTPDILNAEPQAPQIQQEIYDTITQRKEYIGESLNKRKDGSTFICEYKIMPLADSEGKHYAYIAIQRDITESRNMKKLLEDSNKRLNTLLSQTPAVIYSYSFGEDRLPHATYVNENVKNILGYNAEDLLDNPAFFFECVHPDDREKLTKTPQKLFKDKSIQLEYRFIDSQGKYRWLHDRQNLVAYKDGANMQAEVIGTWWDVTEYVEAKNNLIQRDKKLALAQTFSSIGLWEYSFETNKLTWSKECMSLFGITESETQKPIESFEDFLGFVHPEDREYVIEVNNKEKEAGEKYSLNYEHRIIRKDGDIRWIKETAGIIANPKGEVNHIIGFAMDITEQKKREQEIEDSKKQLDHFFSQSLDGIFFMMLDQPVKWDPMATQEEKDKMLDYVFEHQRMTKANKALLEQYGTSEKQFIGSTPFDLFQHNLKHGRQVWQDLFDHGRLHTETFERKADGTPITIKGDYICIYDSDQKITGHFGIQTEITEQKKLEEEKAFQERLQNIITETSSSLNGVLTEDRCNHVINTTLEKLGRLFNADRAYVFQFDQTLDFMSNTHEWCKEGVESQRESVQNQPINDFTWWKNEILKLRPLQIYDVNTVPSENEKREFLRQGICSLVCLPMIGLTGKLCGFLGLDMTEQHYRWEEDQVSMLQLATNTIGNTIERLRIEKKLIKSEEYNRSIVEVIPDLILKINSDGTVIDMRVPQEFENALIVPAEEIVGKKIESFVPSSLNKKTMKSINESINKKKLCKIEYSLEGKNDHNWYEARIIPSNDEGKEVLVLVRDITENKRAMDEIQKISYTDQLTGLCNRRYLENEMVGLDASGCLPLVIMMIDLNGLKIINDTYGHDVGDTALKQASQMLKTSCRKSDIIARWGGDEFVLLLPEITEDESHKIQQRIKANSEVLILEKINMPISLAVGFSVRKSEDEPLSHVLKRAEDDMYKQKLYESRSARSKILDTLLKTLAEKSLETEEHIQRMQNTGVSIAKAINLPDTEIKRLGLAIKLHDIGKINIPEEVLVKPTFLNDEEFELIKRHPEIGARIARSTEEFAHVSEDIMASHERWDGKGYPQGLQKDEIPLLARIVAIADAYDVMKHGRSYKTRMTEDEIRNEFLNCAGTQFDPNLTEIFLNMI